MLAMLCGIMISCDSMVEEIPTNNLLAENSTGDLEENLRKMNITSFGAFLTGTEEVPSVNAMGAGSASFELVDNGRGIKFEVRVANTKGIIFAHIHKGAFGQNGGVIVDLISSQDPTGLKNGVVAEGILTAADLKGIFVSESLADLIDALSTGLAYVNLHTSDNRTGELRGQISPIFANDNSNFTVQLTGDQEIPSVETKAKGVATFRFNKTNSAANFQVNVANLDNVRFAHIHLGKSNQNGGVVVTIKDGKIEGAVNGVYAEGVLLNSNLRGRLLGGDLIILREALRTGNAYVNVHTDKFPSGELRGSF